MIKIQTVSKYLALANEGLVPRMDCPMDQGLLMPNLDNDDTVFLYCMSCGYKKTVGIQLHEKMAGLINGK